MTEQEEPRRLTGEAAWRAHLDDVGKRNAAAKKKAAEHPPAPDVAALARGQRLKAE